MSLGIKKWVWGKRKNEYCQKGVWLRAECCGVVYVKRTSCNREDCKVCGKEFSEAHFRRYMRGIPYIREMYDEGKGIGYLVITTKEDERMEYSEKEKLKELERYIKRMLKRELGEIKGVMRWHFAGDRGKRWYPHLNILLTSEYIEKQKLERIKELIENEYNIKVIHYRYTFNRYKVIHWWRYISRPTFLLQNEVEYEKVKGMKNVIWFGKFKKDYEKIDDEEFLYLVVKLFNEGYFEGRREMLYFIAVHNRCCLCGKKLRYERDIWGDSEGMPEKIPKDTDGIWAWIGGSYWCKKVESRERW